MSMKVKEKPLPHPFPFPANYCIDVEVFLKFCKMTASARKHFLSAIASVIFSYKRCSVCFNLCNCYICNCLIFMLKGTRLNKNLFVWQLQYLLSEVAVWFSNRKYTQIPLSRLPSTGHRLPRHSITDTSGAFFILFFIFYLIFFYVELLHL